MRESDLLFFLRKEDLPANAIHERLVEIVDLIVMPYSTMTKIFRETCWTPFEQGCKNFGG
jgi:hypothetical protein